LDELRRLIELACSQLQSCSNDVERLLDGLSERSPYRLGLESIRDRLNAAVVVLSPEVRADQLDLDNVGAAIGVGRRSLATFTTSLLLLSASISQVSGFTLRDLADMRSSTSEVDRALNAIESCEITMRAQQSWYWSEMLRTLAGAELLVDLRLNQVATLSTTNVVQRLDHAAGMGPPLGADEETTHRLAVALDTVRKLALTLDSQEARAIVRGLDGALDTGGGVHAQMRALKAAVDAARAIAATHVSE
jgi:hypothetical protein